MKFNNMKIITGLCVGLSMAAIAQPTIEQKTFLQTVSNNIKKIVNEAKTKFSNLKDKKNKSPLQNHINGFGQTINAIKTTVVQPLEQMQTRGKQEDTFDQATILFKQIVEQLIVYLQKIKATMAQSAKGTACTKKAKRAKAEHVAKSIKATIDQIKKDNAIKSTLNKIKELQKLLITMQLNPLAKQVQGIHDLCQDLINNNKPMSNSEKLAFVTAIANKL